MSDFLYLLLTLASFAALALLAGYIDRRLDDDLVDGPAESEQPEPEAAVR